MTDEAKTQSAQRQEPHVSARTDHHAMRLAATRPISGPRNADAVAAIGGMELPGRQSHPELVEDEPPAAELIPGERDATTLTSREPGAMGGRFSGADTPSPDPSWVDPEIHRDHRREGGGH